MPFQFDRDDINKDTPCVGRVIARRVSQALLALMLLSGLQIASAGCSTLARETPLEADVRSTKEAADADCPVDRTKPLTGPDSEVGHLRADVVAIDTVVGAVGRRELENQGDVVMALEALDERLPDAFRSRPKLGATDIPMDSTVTDNLRGALDAADLHALKQARERRVAAIARGTAKAEGCRQALHRHLDALERLREAKLAQEANR